MTKTEFQAQFKRLRVAGYRLPVFDGITVADVIAEWFETFKGCTEREFSDAIDRLKQHKTDTFWPATGEIWQHVFEVRKAQRIRRQTTESGGEWSMSDEARDEFLGMLRATMAKIASKRTMPAATVQTVPDHAN